jgi:hypothetical protein
VSSAHLLPWDREGGEGRRAGSAHLGEVLGQQIAPQQDTQELTHTNTHEHSGLGGWKDLAFSVFLSCIYIGSRELQLWL